MSNLSLDARIPAQAYQSFMSMQTVAYTQENLNNVYVSHWQLWLQGSDFDIDKLFMMMYGFRNGMIIGWSPFFTAKSNALLEKSLQLPIPINLHYKSTNKPFNKIDTLLIDDVSPRWATNDESVERLLPVLNYLYNNRNIKFISYNKTGLTQDRKARAATPKRHKSFFINLLD